MSEEARGPGRGLAAPGVLALGMVAAAVVLGLAFYAARRPAATVQVVGLASQPFEADIVKWNLTLGRTVPAHELQSAYARMRDDVRRLAERVTARGIAAEEVTPQPVTTNPVFDASGISGYQVLQTVLVISERLDEVEALALSPADLVTEGVVLQNSQLEYFYSGLADVKRSLLAQATEDARLRAEEIAASAGGRLRRLTSARAGVFQITEPFSTEVAAYGIFNTASREKEIRVTVHATFALE